MSTKRILSALALLVILTAASPVLGGAKHGGQAVEIQGYHFELVVEPESGGAHLDLFINDPKSKAVSDAAVQLQVSAPGGQKLSLPMKYGEGHYEAVLPAAAKGVYRVVALATVGGKKLNSRFSFKL
ncbi:hypothetical protein [Gloeobacter morelensis]|uniref:YtkA-like domain-containing protein n=1 Tax=Gloeobacter morelensis MG652769 TaxID=2781736 RepID=A0ABY3PHT0_9CYAN|nr:hypothetical protein [Gloeobacter morelensis]UFP93186.1 hypothetical protein ISF26_15400 [Gloeobacter morelensis MG652769]